MAAEDGSYWLLGYAWWAKPEAVVAPAAALCWCRYCTLGARPCYVLAAVFCERTADKFLYEWPTTAPPGCTRYG